MAKSDDLKAQGPPPPSGGATAATTRTPLGVPEGFTTPGRYSPDPFDTELRQYAGTPTGARGPTFFSGDEYIPGGLAPEVLYQYQQLLVQAGLMKGKFRVGVWDETTSNAYKQVLEFANRNGITDEREAFQRLITSPEVSDDATAGASRAPLTTRVANPADIRAYIKKGATETLGRGISDDEVESLVREFQATQVAEQTQAYNTAETGGQTVDGPSLETFTDDRLRQNNPLQAQGDDMADAFGRLDRILAGASGGE